MSFSVREQVGDLSAGFDGSYHGFSQGKLGTETLAALCTASRENGAAALGSHTCTEAVSLCALAGVRLIGALHYFSFQIYSNFEIIR